MAEKIDPTWIGYAFDRPVAPERVSAGLDRVATHYGDLVSYPLAVRAGAAGERGIAVVGDVAPLAGWPTLVTDRGLTLASAYPPAGWQRITGAAPSAGSALTLAEAILADPDCAARTLTGPLVAGALSEPEGRLVIVNDCIGAGRLYETRFAEGSIWSNRAAAGHVFAGRAPRPDPEAWLGLAAVGWFFGEATPFASVRKVPRGTVIEVSPEGVRRRATDAVGELVRPDRGRLDEALDAAAEAAVEQARLAASAWSRRPVVHLSGGRDSRLVAAAAMRAGIDAVLRTSDAWPGEADIARQLLAVAPREMEHVVVRDNEESASPETPLMDRAVRTQLLHDGMRQASKIRFDVPLPRDRPDRATMAGWGGEIAHAHYYQDSRQLLKVRLGGTRAVLRRLEESSRKKHLAAHEDAYEAARAGFRERIGEGRRYGLRGADLLDWFYLVERFVNRFEVGADSQTVSVYTSPDFIRAAFATSPRQRLEAHAHGEIIRRLVPAWATIPFYRRPAGPRPQVRRQRLWEEEGDARAVEVIVRARGAWTELFRPERIDEMWAELRAGGGFANWETVFERIVCREAFAALVESVTRSAAVGPPLFD